MSNRDGYSEASPMLGLLLRLKGRALWNRACQVVHEGPVRLATTVILVGVVWLGLHFMFWVVFAQLRRTVLEATVAIPLVLNFFFVAILVMLTFSNAIILYGSLFGRDETAFLLTKPLTPLDVVTIKYVEGLMISSWSLVLLGLPLMLAMARQAQHPAFYVLFVAFFLAFIPIPGSLGMLLAWAVARFFPTGLARWAMVVVAGLMTGGLVWLTRSISIGESATEAWLHHFLSRMSFVQFALLPNYWVASGIDQALQLRFGESAMYLGVTAANALFLSWLVVRMVARRFETAYSRACTGRGGARPPAPVVGGLPGFVFSYLPLPLRLIAVKDLRTFLRDPLQWSQLAILFGLFTLYLTHIPTLWLHLSGTGWFLAIPFLNLCATSLILATFTCRFVFPLVSLEGQNLWLIRLLPMPLGRVLLAKFAFAMTVTLAVAIVAVSLAAYRLEVKLPWAALHIGVTAAVCFGLCGLAVGLGARLPMFAERNAARIANGFGGTTNLLISVALVAAALTGVGVATWRARDAPIGSLPDGVSLLLSCAGALLAIGVGWQALRLGAKHFDRIEV